MSKDTIITTTEGTTISNLILIEYDDGLMALARDYEHDDMSRNARWNQAGERVITRLPVVFSKADISSIITALTATAGKDEG